MKKFYLIFIGFLLGAGLTVMAAAPTIQVINGGTGSTTLTGILIGNGKSSVGTLTVGSNLTLTGTTLSASGGGSGSGTITTSTLQTLGNIPYWTSSGSTFPATLGSMAIASATCSSGASCSGFSVVGTVSPAITVSGLTTTNFSSANISQWTNNSGYITSSGVFAWPFTPTPNFGVTANATGTLMLLTAGLSASTTIRFGDASDQGQFYFKSSQGLGIGTSTPQWALTISSSTAPQITLTDASNTATPWNFRSVNGNLYVSTSSPNTFATSSVPALTLRSGVPSLLIGTSTGTSGIYLDMYAAATSSIRIDTDAAKGGCIVMKDSDGTGYTYLTASGGVLTASTNSCL